MEKEFPLQCFRDKSAEVQPRGKQPTPPAINDFFAADQSQEVPPAQVDETFEEVRLKFSGFGGQGILSLGHCVAEAARLENRFTTWFPSYGPEQRGGAAACSVVISGKPIGSPSVDHPNVLVCMNQPSYERFVGTVAPGGTVIVDATVTRTVEPPVGVKLVVMPAIDLATKLGVPKAANTMMLVALSKHGVTHLTRDNLLNALVGSFWKKPALAEKNRFLFTAAEAEIK
jgi:2-oxoisovalerate ferredoxin oxidoreductase beta subunit